MLFTFSYFWKCAAILMCAWGVYGVLGYEFAVITLLSTLVCLTLRDTQP